MILKKKREFFRYKRQFLQVSIFSFLGFAKFAKFTIKTTNELVKFYSLTTENKEHYRLRLVFNTQGLISEISFFPWKSHSEGLGLWEAAGYSLT